MMGRCGLQLGRHHFAPGKIFRIIDFDVIAFLGRVSREMCIFESRAIFFGVNA